MNLVRLWAVARKEFIHIIRDPRSLGMAIGLPMMLLVLFGYALTLDVDRIPLVVWDQSSSAGSRDFTSRFTGSRYFSLVGHVDGYGWMERAIDRREALAGLVIPADFDRRLSSGAAAPVQFIVDGSDSNTATFAIGYAESVTEGYSRQLALEASRRFGLPPAAAPLEVRARVWFNSDMESKDFIIPGLIAVIMMVIAALLTSLTVAREWERGTMEQLISTPVRGHELILGKLVPYFAIGMLDVLIAVLMGRFLFHVPLRGSVVLLFAVAAVFLVGALSLGMLVGIIARNQLLAMQMGMILTLLPAFLLSGFAYAIPNMPRPIQLVTYLVPARYFVLLIRGIYLKGVGLRVLAWDALMLCIFAAAMLALANGKFRKRLQ